MNRDNYILESIPIEKELEILFRQKADITIFEIGACEGEDSIRYSNLFPQARIYAFEPLPYNIERIHNNIKKYNKQNIAVHQCALSNFVGSSMFHVSSGAPEGIGTSDDWDYGNKSSSLLPPDKHLEMFSFISFDKQITVNTSTVDVFCKEKGITAIDFVHLDVQGAELMVLNGTHDLLPTIKAIWLEVSKVTFYKDQPLIDEVDEFMLVNNFVLVKDATNAVTGDRLYVSNLHYSDPKKLLANKKKETMFDWLIGKLKK